MGLRRFWELRGGARYNAIETVCETSGKVLIGFTVVPQAGKEIIVAEGMSKAALMQFFLQQSPDLL